MAMIKDSGVVMDWDQHTVTIRWPMKKRSYGERLLRAAAKGEDTSKIKPDDEKLYTTSIESSGVTATQLYDYIKEELRNDDATDAMAYSMAATTDCEYTFAGNETKKG